MLNAFKSLFILTKNSSIVATLSYILTITIANVLGPKDFGIYSMVFIVTAIFSIFINYETDRTAAIQSVHTKDNSAVLKEILGARVLVLALSIIGLLLYTMIGNYMALYVICMIIGGLNLGFYYEINSRNESYSYIYLFQRLLYVGAVFIVVYLGKLNLNIIFSLFILSTLLSLIYQYYGIRNILKKIYKINWNKVKKIFIKNISLVIVALSLFSYGGFSRLILEDSLGLEKLGIYSAGWQLITIATVFQSQVNKVWRLKMSSAVANVSRGQLMALLKSYFIFATVPIIILAIMMGMFSNFIVNTLYTSAYSELIYLLPVLSIYLVVINFTGLAGILWVALGKNSIYMLINIIFSILLLSILLLLPKNTELVGFALSTIVVQSFMVLVLFGTWYILFFNKLIRH